MSQYFKGSGPFDFFGPLGAHLLNFFGNIARARATRRANMPPGALAGAGELPPGAGTAAAAAYGPAARKPHGFALLCPLTMGATPTTLINADQRDAGRRGEGRIVAPHGPKHLTPA